MSNKKKNKKQHKHTVKLKLSMSAASGLEQLKDFFSSFGPHDAQEELWDMFHYSMISEDQSFMGHTRIRDKFYFYDRLRKLLQGVGKIVGV